jgi:hypothetical protein
MRGKMAKDGANKELDEHKRPEENINGEKIRGRGKLSTEERKEKEKMKSKKEETKEERTIFRVKLSRNSPWRR